MKFYFLPIFIALVTYQLVTGFAPFDPQNILWLATGEPLTPYLGWEVFRASAWENPIGLNPRYGLEEIGSSIVFSDSIPILAIIFKLISPILPSQFQYFGIWILVALILQAILTSKVVAIFSKSSLANICIVIMTLFLPAMLYRINVHISLAGHFLILWAIYLNLKKGNNAFSWMLLVLISLGCQFYLLIMVMALWTANIFDKYKDLSAQALILNFLLVTFTLFFGGWQYGYFAIPSGISAGQGYGIYQANILSFINPIDWSYFFDKNLYVPRNHEGNNYLGLGVILMVTCSLPTLLIKNTRALLSKHIHQHFFLLLAVIVLALFAFSNSIDFGKYNLHIPLDESIVSLLSTLRASGRMLWPLIYILIFSSFWLLEISLSSKRFLALVMCFAILQVIDTSKGWKGLHKYFQEFRGTEIPTSLVSSFWNQAPKMYTTIRLVPPQNWYHRWADIAAYSAKNNISTSLVYTSRTDTKKLENSRKLLEENLVSGNLDRNTIYVFQKWSDNLYQPDPKFDPDQDLFAKIDGTTLLAPGYKKCHDCQQIDTSLEIQSLIPKVSLNTPILFSKDGDGGELLLSGWAWPESWGIWSYGKTSSLAIPLGSELPNKIQLSYRALLGPNHPKSFVEIYINGEIQDKLEIVQSTNNLTTLDIPVKLKSQRFILLEFRYLNPSSPLNAGIGSQDDRILTIGLQSLRLIK